MPRPRLRDPSGQASVELVALLPLVVVVAACAWQAVVAGQAVWLAGTAARAAARAQAVGADARAAATGALPGRLRRGLAVRTEEDGAVRVVVRIPVVVGGMRLAAVGARARMEPQR